MLDNKDYLGKILFVCSFLLLGYMFISPFNSILGVDEYFTLGLVKLPLNWGIMVTASDVHPPLYYMLLKGFLTVFNPSYDNIIFSKVFSIIPYVIILIVSLTKIRNKYGWLSAGLVSLTLASSHTVFLQFVDIRMYSWALLFFLLSFIYLGDVLEFGDKKSWALLSLFTVLGAYTHYFAAISSVIMYLFVLAYFIFKHEKGQVKKWFASTVIGIIAYVPWLTVLFNQLNRVHNGYWIPDITPNYLVNCITYFATKSEMIFLQIAMVLVLVVLIGIILKESRKDDSHFYIFLGLSLFISTIVLTYIISMTFKPILRTRYLIPAITVLWFTISIYAGKIKSKKLLGIYLIVIMLVCGLGVVQTIDYTNEEAPLLNGNEVILKDITGSDENIIITNDYMHIAQYLNTSNVYLTTQEFSVPTDEMADSSNYHLEDNITEIIKANPDKKIYVIEVDWNEMDIPDSVTLAESPDQLHLDHFTIYEVKK